MQACMVMLAQLSFEPCIFIKKLPNECQGMRNIFFMWFGFTDQGLMDHGPAVGRVSMQST